MSYIAVGCEFYVNESTKYITYGVFKRKHTYNKATYWLADENVMTRGLQGPNPIFMGETVIQCWLIQCWQWCYRI